MLHPVCNFASKWLFFIRHGQRYDTFYYKLFYIDILYKNKGLSENKTDNSFFWSKYVNFDILFRRILTLFRRMHTLLLRIIILFRRILTLFRRILTLFLRILTLFLRIITLFRRFLTLFRKILTLFLRILTLFRRILPDNHQIHSHVVIHPFCTAKSLHLYWYLYWGNLVPKNLR